MIIEGLLLGTVSFISLATVYHKMPQRFKDFCVKHSLMTDLLSTIGTYLTLGSISSSVVAAFAAAWVGIMFEVYMHFLKANGHRKEVLA